MCIVHDVCVHERERRREGEEGERERDRETEKEKVGPVKGPESFLSCVSTCFLRQSLSLDVKLTSSARLWAARIQRDPIEHWGFRHEPSHWACLWVLRI